MPLHSRAALRALGAGVGALVLGALVMVGGPGPAGAQPGKTAADQLAFEPPIEPEPEPSESSSEPPPPPDPVAGVVVGADDVTVGTGYWQGTRERYTLSISVTNTGDATSQISGAFTLPNGVRRVSVSGAGGCADSGGWMFSCTLGASASGDLTVQVSVDADAWRRAPLAGAVAVTSTVVGRPDIGASDRDEFSVTLPAGPPTPGIFLDADDLTVGLRGDGAQLGVVLRNTGSVSAAGAVEVVTPPGVQIAAVPAQCANRVKVAPNRERCEVGRLAAGAEQILAFALSVRVDSRDGPLTGAVHGSLTPSGQDTVTVQASYRILFSPLAASASPSPSGSAAPTETGAALPRSEPDLGMPAKPLRNLADNVSRQLSVLPIVAAMVGLVTILGVLVVLSLRRRMRDDIKPPAA